MVSWQTGSSVHFLDCLIQYKAADMVSRQTGPDVHFVDCLFQYKAIDVVSWQTGSSVHSVNCLFQYKATDMVMGGPGKLELVFTPAQGTEQRLHVFEFKKGGGVGMAMYNTDEVGCLQLSACLSPA